MDVHNINDINEILEVDEEYEGDKNDDDDEPPTDIVVRYGRITKFVKKNVMNENQEIR